VVGFGISGVVSLQILLPESYLCS